MTRDEMVEALARKLAEAHDLDPDMLMLPRMINGRLPLPQYDRGWAAPREDMIVPAWRLYARDAETAIDFIEGLAG